VLRGDEKIGAVTIHLTKELMEKRLWERAVYKFVTQAFLSAFLVVFLWLFLDRFVIRPLQDILATARAVGEGDYGREIAVRQGDEIGQLADEKLKEMDQLKSMFIASMSHELRTPLNSIIGFTGMTLEGLSGTLNEEQQDNLRRVHQSGQHLLGLISDVIDISKIEAGRIEAYPERFSLKEIIDESVASIRPLADKKHL